MEKVLGEGNTPISNLKDFPKLMMPSDLIRERGFGKLNFVRVSKKGFQTFEVRTRNHPTLRVS